MTEEVSGEKLNTANSTDFEDRMSENGIPWFQAQVVLVVDCRLFFP